MENSSSGTQKAFIMTYGTENGVTVCHYLVFMFHILCIVGWTYNIFDCLSTAISQRTHIQKGHNYLQKQSNVHGTCTSRFMFTKIVNVVDYIVTSRSGGSVVKALAP